MASGAVPSRPHTGETAASTSATLSYLVRDVVLARLASLKIAVTLFAMGIFIILVGTLAQARIDMWEVMDQYFLSWIAWIDFQVFLPPSWFPDRQNVGGGFFFPGGAMIGMGMVINLAAAHLSRFRIQARGQQLLLGLAGLAGAALFTAAIVVSGHNYGGFQDEPWLEWTTLWLMIRVGVIMLAAAALVGAVLRSDPNQRMERWALAGIGGLLAALAVYLFAAGRGAYLGDSGMRILWQLIQATLAGIAILLACRVLYRKRGAVVTIHLGIGLLMFGQYWVAKHDVEEQISLGEGETASFARDIRQTELAIVDRSNPNQDEVIAIPQSLLNRSFRISDGGRMWGSDSRVDEQGIIRDESLPFDLQVLEYYKNSNLEDVEDGQENLATAGSGLRMQAVPVRGSTGAGGDGSVDLSAAYVKVLDKQGEELGVYMLSQLASMQDIAEKVSVDGKTYDVSLRYRRNYKPYSMTLIDVRKDDYLGTSTPRNYSSDVRLVDRERNVDRKLHIWMNNPRRFAGETFYQSGYSGPPRTPKESTTIAVVTNSGWMIPYVACMVVMVGLVGHFSGTLLRFLNRMSRGVAPREQPEPDTKPQPSRERPPISWGKQLADSWLAIVCVGIFAVLFAYMARPHAEENDEFRIHQFGELPVVSGGRVKPFDSLARNSLRVLSNRYTFRARLSDEDLEEKWPEIKQELQDRWHAVSADDLETHRNDMDGLIDAIVEATEEEREIVLAQVDKLTTESQPAIRWLLDVATDPTVAEQHKVVRIDNLEVLDTLGLSRRKSHLYSIDEIRGRYEEFSKQLQLAAEADVNELSVYQRKLIELDQRIRTYTRLVASFQPPNLPPLPTPEQIKEDEAKAIESLQRFQRAYMSFLRMMKSGSPPLSVPVTDQDGNEKWESYAVAWANALFEARLTGKSPAPAMTHMNTALVAYQQGDVSAFNDEVDKYQRLLEREPPEELRGANTTTGRYVEARFGSFYAFEAYFNKVSPFFFCWWPYILAFALACFGWLGWSRPLNRAAFWLIVFAFVIHTAALGARIYLSGRPPVTNLYSSALFIGWGGALVGLVLEAVFRIGVGNVIGAVMGFASLLIAHNLAGDGDTMTVLQAVLDTQFWLTIHVLTVTAGYMATFVAGGLGVLYIVLGWCTKLLDADLRRVFGRMIYGVVCFALVFSFFGTILGGLWADDSWGRFWGWDPKENGALIIVLWNIMVLHCRWDGMIKDRGLAIMAVGGNIVTGWSWFGVNELGVGLHSYGFTEGVLRTLGLFVLSQLFVIGMGLLPQELWLSSRSKKDPTPAV